MHLTRTAVLAALVLGTAACGLNRGRSATTRNTIETAEIRASSYADAYTLVRTLRPHWLRVRGPASISFTDMVQVYLDGSRMGGPEQLRLITTGSIRSIEYLDARQATNRWGTGHGSGAVMVSTRTHHSDR